MLSIHTEVLFHDLLLEVKEAEIYAENLRQELCALNSSKANSALMKAG